MVGSLLSRARRQAEQPAIGHRVHGVLHEVDHRRAQLPHDAADDDARHRLERERFETAQNESMAESNCAMPLCGTRRRCRNCLTTGSMRRCTTILAPISRGMARRNRR